MKTRRTYLVIFFLLAIATAMAACSPNSNADVVVGAEQNGTKVTMRSDQTLIVQLASNITTGYSWAIAECDEQVLKPQGDPEYLESDRSQKLVGSGGAEVFRFKPVAAGAIHLKLEYRRPWEKDVKPAETFDVDVTVQ